MLFAGLCRREGTKVPDSQMQNPDRILIIKLSAIGDLVHALPFLEVLKKRFPHARIDWLVEEDAYQVIKGHPAINHVIVSGRKAWQRRLLNGKEFLPAMKEISNFIRDVRRYKYDLVIDLQGLLKSGILVCLSKGRQKIGMTGSREGAGIFLNVPPFPVDYNQHALKRYLSVARYLGCDISSWKGDIPVFESDKRAVRRLLDKHRLLKRPIIAINPMARWETKLWEPDRFADLADRIRDNLSCDIIFTGSGNDKKVIKEISGMMKERPVNLAGKTSLKELACLYSISGALVTTDTGPMHIAAAMGCPVIALFGPTDPLRTGPYGRSHRVVRADLECSPCFKKSCSHKNCMKDITVEMVFEAVKDTLVKNGNRGAEDILRMA